MRYHWYWRPGWQPGTRFYTFHITWRDQPGVQKLGERARERLAGIPGLDPVPGEWLHLTMQGVGFAHKVSDADVEAITAAARARLASVAPAVIRAPPPPQAGFAVSTVRWRLSLPAVAADLAAGEQDLGGQDSAWFELPKS